MILHQCCPDNSLNSLAIFMQTTMTELKDCYIFLFVQHEVIFINRVLFLKSINYLPNISLTS
jgi:hypothetical protein